MASEIETSLELLNDKIRKWDKMPHLGMSGRFEEGLVCGLELAKSVVESVQKSSLPHPIDKGEG